MEEQTITCIICLRTDGGTARREHVLQDGLGARFKLPRGVVCDRCNHATSVLDKDLINFVRVTRRENNGKPLLSGGTAICRLDGRWWRTFVNDQSWERTLPPQLLILPNGTVKAWGQSRAEIQQMVAELSPTAFPNVKGGSSWPFEAELRGQPLVVRSKPGFYQVLAADESEQRAVEQSIVSGQISNLPWEVCTGLEATLATTQVPVVGDVSYNIAHAHRALLKVTLSFIGYSLAPELARSRVFDDLRRGVLEGKSENGFELGVEDIQRVAQPGERLGLGRDAAVAFALFDRKDFVQAQAVADALFRSGKHSLAIGCAYGHINVLVTFYGVPHAYLIYSVPEIGWCPTGVWAAVTIDPGKGAANNDEVGRPKPGDLELISRYLRELSLKYEGERTSTKRVRASKRVTCGVPATRNALG
jgi:hypothetical protein